MDGEDTEGAAANAARESEPSGECGRTQCGQPNAILLLRRDGRQACTNTVISHPVHHAEHFFRLFVRASHGSIPSATIRIQGRCHIGSRCANALDTRSELRRYDSLSRRQPRRSASESAATKAFHSVYSLRKLLSFLALMRR